MQRRTDLVDQFPDLTENYNRGFHWYLQTGIRNQEAEECLLAPVGTLDRGAHLIDADGERSACVHQNGINEAIARCDEWAMRCEWQANHVCPLQKNTQVTSYGFHGDTPFKHYVEEFQPCIGLSCAYWDFSNGGNVPCLLVVPQPGE